MAWSRGEGCRWSLGGAGAVFGHEGAMHDSQKYFRKISILYLKHYIFWKGKSQGGGRGPSRPEALPYTAAPEGRRGIFLRKRPCFANARFGVPPARPGCVEFANAWSETLPGPAGPGQSPLAILAPPTSATIEKGEGCHGAKSKALLPSRAGRGGEGPRLHSLTSLKNRFRPCVGRANATEPGATTSVYWAAAGVWLL